MSMATPQSSQLPTGDLFQQLLGAAPANQTNTFI
jgi:hypothetical protein